MAPTLPRVWRKFKSLVANTADPNKVGSDRWNDDINVDLGSVCEALKTLDIGPDKFAYFTGANGAALATILAYGRLLVAAQDAPAARALLGAVNRAGDTMLGALAMNGNAVTGLPIPSAPSDAVRKADLDALAAVMSGALVFKGAWDASAGTFPGAGVAQTGWFYKVSVAGTVNGQLFTVGDDVFAIINNASPTTYANNWLKVEGSITRAEIEAALGFTLGSLAAMSSITASLISDASANGRSLIMAANFGAMKALLAIAAGDVSGLGSLATASSVTAAQISNASANGRSLLMAADYAAMKVLLGLAVVATSGAYGDLSGRPTLGTAAALNVGTSANNVVQLDGTGKLPAVDASQLTSVPGSTAAATQAQQEAASATNVFVAPGRQQYHPSAAKAWVNFNGAGTVAIRRSFNVSSITDNGIGDYTVNFTTAFSAADYAFALSAGRGAATAGGWASVCEPFTVDPTVNAFRFITVSGGGAANDPPWVGAAFFGDQP